jgi:hypothetical protein
MYDPPSNTWTTLPAMSHPSACGGTGAINGTLYVTTACNWGWSMRVMAFFADNTWVRSNTRWLHR